MKEPEKKISKLRNMLRKRILWLLFGLALFGALLLVAMPVGLEYGFKRYLLSQGVDQTDLEDVDFNPFTRRLVVKNLTVEVGAEQVLNVSEAGFTLAWSPFFKKRFVLEKVDLANSTITIEELTAGRWRIGGLAPPPPEKSSSASSWAFGLAELHIQNSRVNIRSARLTSELKIAQARLTRLRSWQPDQDTRLDFKGTLNDGLVQFDGNVSPFGDSTTVDGAVKVNGLALAPFAQLIAADASALQGRLDADVRIQSKYGSDKELQLDQTGRLTLNQVRMRFADVELSDQKLTWDGTLRVKSPAASDELKITANGQLRGQDGIVNPNTENLQFQHGGLGWKGALVLSGKKQTSDLNINGALELQKFRLAARDMNVAEENLLWDGYIVITLPEAPGALSVAAAGKMTAKGTALDTPSANFKLQATGLDWNGELALDAQKQASDVKIDGALNLSKLEVGTADVLLAEEDLRWNGALQMLLPESAADQRLTTNGSLESRRQTIALLRKKLNVANENLSWKGRLSASLTDVGAALAAEGDFSLTDLAITAAPRNLRLLASKAIDLKSIKGDAAAQFSIAAAKITGLDLVGQAEPSKKASLLSASEVQLDTVNFERLKKVSIQSARMVDAKGLLHQKNDGRWLFIEDLKTFLADSGASAPKKPAPQRAVPKAQPPAKKADTKAGIQIGRLEIVGDSVVHFEDETISPAFSTQVRLKTARLKDINSNQPEQASPIILEAESRKYTRLKMKGKVQPFAERISMDIKGNIKAVEMPPLSPYAVNTIGYNLKSGEMDADIELKITAGKLEGEGDLKFYNPIVEAVHPEKLEGRQGSSIPLQSALKVLRDKDKDVRLKIPISGDVSDPKFSFTNALNQALIKGLSLATLSYLKYMLGPYGTAIGVVELGVKVGSKVLTGIRLNPVEFQPAASELDPAVAEYLNKVAAILKEKKDLRLRLCGWATESDQMGQHTAAAQTPTAPSEADSFETKSPPGGQIKAQSDDRLALSEKEMLALAEQRADRIEDILVGQHGIKDKRIFICQPQIDKNPDAKPRVDLVF